MEITLRGRKIPLLYTVLEMKQMQEEIAPLHQLPVILFGGEIKEDGPKTDDEAAEEAARELEEDKPAQRVNYGTPQHLDCIAKCVRIMGNAGLEEAGEEPDLTDKWVMRALKPVQLVPTVNAIVDAMNEGMRSEIPEEKPQGPVDVVLEEVKKKDGTEK